MRRPFLQALLLGFAALCVHGLAAAQCTKDIDCKGDRVCEAGKCTWPAAPATPVAAATSPTDPPPPVAATGPQSDAQPPLPRGQVAPGDSTTPRTPPAAASAAVPQLAASPSAPSVPVRLPPGDEPVHEERRSRTAMVGGIVMVSIGPLALLGALAARNAQARCDDRLEQDYPDHAVPTSQAYRLERCDSYSTTIYALGIGGAVLVAAGIPLIIYGAKTVKKPNRSTLNIDPWASRTSAGLRLRLEM